MSSASGISTIPVSGKPASASSRLFPRTPSTSATSKRRMVSFRVRSLDAMAPWSSTCGVIPRDAQPGLYDPEGNPIEMWEPAGRDVQELMWGKMSAEWLSAFPGDEKAPQLDVIRQQATSLPHKGCAAPHHVIDSTFLHDGDFSAT